MLLVVRDVEVWIHGPPLDERRFSDRAGVGVRRRRRTLRARNLESSVDDHVAMLFARDILGGRIPLGAVQVVQSCSGVAVGEDSFRGIAGVRRLVGMWTRFRV